MNELVQYTPVVTAIVASLALLAPWRGNAAWVVKLILVAIIVSNTIVAWNVN